MLPVAFLCDSPPGRGLEAARGEGPFRLPRRAAPDQSWGCSRSAMATAVGEALRAKYAARRGPADDQIAILPRDEDGEAEEDEAGGCASKTVSFAVLPDKYEPLGRGEKRPEALGLERKSGRRRRKLKKYGKVSDSRGRSPGKPGSHLCRAGSAGARAKTEGGLRGKPPTPRPPPI